MISQATYSRLKGRLTRAKNSKDDRKIVAEAAYAWRIFQAEGFPDAWAMWRSAGDDARYRLEREGVRVANPTPE